MDQINKINLDISSIVYKLSDKFIEVDNPIVNYYPQNEDKFYQDQLPSKLEIREFILENKKEEIKNVITENLKSILAFGKSGLPIKNEVVTQEKESTTNKSDDKPKTSEVLNSYIEKILEAFPSKAFVVKTNHTMAILPHYERIKKELELVKQNDFTKIGPKNILFYLLSTLKNIEKNIIQWESSTNSKFYGEIDIDLFGKEGFKKFIENAAYLPYKNMLSFGTFMGPNQKIYNASQDTDVVTHELGHSLLDRLRSTYIDSIFHLESNAVHEAFSDINAFLYAAKDPNVEIKPNELDNPNIISSIAEYLGKAIYTQIKIQKVILEQDPFIDLNQIEDNRSIRELTSFFEYKPYSQLKENEKEEHKYSLALSSTFYRAFSNYAKDVGDVRKAAEEFFKIFVIGTTISPVATTTIPDFYKSIIVADILYNNSKLSNYLIQSAKQSKIFDQNIDIETIKQEIRQSTTLDLSDIKQHILSNNKKEIERILLSKLKEKYPDFSSINKIEISIVPNVNGSVNIQGLYSYPTKISINNQSYPIYGGILLVFDKDLNLIYTNIERPSFQKVADMQDYSNNL